ncbi:MAG: DUF4158 domain-containing protein [Actinomycetota bacterium]|nr:DUF4158 domain-containing protein [Actinomycetota bacterium]
MVGLRSAEHAVWEFLTDAQVAGYGRFDGVPSRGDLERFFVCDEVDRKLIGGRRGEHNRLGLMLQATTVRYVGRFLEDPLDVPWPVAEYVAAQLGITDASCVKRYTDRPMTAYEHAWQIRDAYGFRVFEDVEATAQLRQFLDGREWTHAEGPGALFDHGVGWLRRHRVLLPGITVLTRLVRTCRRGHGSPSWSPGVGHRPGCRVRAWSRPWTGPRIWKAGGCGRWIVRRCRQTGSRPWPATGWRARP